MKTRAAEIRIQRLSIINFTFAVCSAACSATCVTVKAASWALAAPMRSSEPILVINNLVFM